MLLARARQEARALIGRDPALERAENAEVRRHLVQRWGEREKLYEVG